MTQSASQEEVVTCATHRGVVTNLRCGKCDKPICPQCLVHTPVGARCRECAQLRRLPVFQVRPGDYLRAAGAGVGVAAVAGLVWGSLPFGGFFAFFLGPIAGYFIGEAVSRAANRRRSTGLKVLAGVGVFLAYLLSRAGEGSLVLGGSLLLAGAPGPMAALLYGALLGALVNPFAWIIVAIGAYVAVSRVG